MPESQKGKNARLRKQSSLKLLKQAAIDHDLIPAKPGYGKQRGNQMAAFDEVLSRLEAGEMVIKLEDAI